MATGAGAAAGAFVVAAGATWDDGAGLGLGPTSLATVAASGVAAAWAEMVAEVDICIGADAGAGVEFGVVAAERLDVLEAWAKCCRVASVAGGALDIKGAWSPAGLAPETAGWMMAAGAACAGVDGALAAGVEDAGAALGWACAS